MKVEFSKIICEDAFGCDHLEFNFVSGIHNVGGLNGAGKTTIYLALAQGLFNKNPKGTKVDDVSNIVTGRPYCITILFSKGADSYKVVNSRKTGNITVEMNGKSLTRKTIPQNLELIREILGDTYETFISMTYQSTESTLDLVEENSDAARKGFINRILKFDELDSLLVFNKDKLKQLKLQTKGKFTLTDTLKARMLPLREVGELSDLGGIEEKVEAVKLERDTYSSTMEKALANVRRSEADLEAFYQFEKDQKKLDEICTLKDKMVRPSRYWDELEAYIAKCNKNVAEYELLLRQNRKHRAELKEPELVCSKCGNEVNSTTALEVYDREVRETDETISEVELLLKEAKGLLWLANEDALYWKKYDELYKEHEAIVNSIKPAAFYTKEDHQNVVNSLQQAKLTATYISDTYDAMVKELAEAKGKNELVQMVAKFNQEAESSNMETMRKVAALEDEVTALEKRMELIEIWVRILGSNGYRVHRMSQFLKVLNQLMAKYSNIISKGKIRCSFYVTEEGKVEFNVIDADKSIPFSGWSGGEKSRVKLACLFAVIEILEVMGSASYNVLFLDEVFATLDEGGREGLFEVLASLKSTGKCIYTVSHTPIANAVVFDSQIKVIKENGISRID